jgi:hypothetical protein
MTTWITQIKNFIGGWLYNQPGFTYNQALDPISGDPVTYDSVGLADPWTTQTKS